MFAPFTLVFVCLVFFIAGAVKGVVGLGMPTVAIGLLAILMPPAQAAALVIVPALVTNLLAIGRPGACRSAAAVLDAADRHLRRHLGGSRHARGRSLR